MAMPLIFLSSGRIFGIDKKTQKNILDMATLAFTLDGQNYVSDVFSGGNVVQLSFPTEGTQVLFVETRLGATLPWKTIDSRIVERDLVVNIPSAGEGQEFRLACIAQPTAAEIVPMKESGGGGSQPGPNTVGTDQIIDGAVQEEDLSPEIEAGDGDIDSIFNQGASTAPTVPTQPLVVEEEEES
jgi:hypothetical protein